MRSVLVATDFSAGAKMAMGRSVLLPFESGATLWLVHVLSGAVPEKYAEAVRDRAGNALHAEAEEWRRLAAERGVAAPRVECALLTGTPHVEIIRHARTRSAELVVVGRHGKRALGDAVLGSTAERVVRKGDVPVLVVKQEASGAYRRALLASDLEDTVVREVELAFTLLPEAARLTLLHAYHVAFEGWFGASTLDELRQEQAKRSRQAASKVASMLGEEGVECHTVICEGDPRIVVLREAARESSDLIVVGTHARAGVAHALLGSVAEWLIRASPCDVAVTRPARFTFELP